MVDPRVMCRQHLLGEHVEIHMLIGAARRGRSLAGFAFGGLVELDKLKQRHDELAAEMTLRGYEHMSPVPEQPEFKDPRGVVDANASLHELASRCAACRQMQLTERTPR